MRHPVQGNEFSSHL